MKLAIIPARGGSKRIPRKNIKIFCGKPSIAWSIEAALNSECFDRVIVSTDDHEIADVALAYGAEVPFIRPPHLADDTTGTIPVVAHAVAWMSAEFVPVEFACCVYATAPFVQPQDLRHAFQILKDSGAEYVFTVTSFAAPLQRAFRITNDYRISMFDPSKFDKRSQDLEAAYHDAAQFYWGKAEAWLSRVPLYSDSSVPLVLPRHRVQDLDTQDDWLRAELMFKILNRSKESEI